MTDRLFDDQYARQIAEAAGINAATPRRAYIGDGRGNINAIDDTDKANTLYIRFNPDDNDFTFAYYDVTQNSQQYVDGLAVKVRPYHEDKVGNRVRWVIMGADEIIAADQIGEFPPDPDGGFGAVGVHDHSSAAQGGQLDIGIAVNAGVLAAMFGGTGNDLTSTPDGAPLLYNSTAERIEGAFYPFGRLLVGRDGDALETLAGQADFDTVQSRDTGGAQDWKAIANNLSATTDPTTGDDFDDRYNVGSWWINQTTVELYVCRDATVGAAVWSRVALDQPRANLSATTDPTATDDDAAGYAVASLWFNVTDQQVFVCWDASTGAAVWKELGTETLNNLTATLDPTTSDDETAGYAVGSLWYNTVTYVLWMCIDVTTGNAVWVAIGGTAGVPKPVTSITTDVSLDYSYYVVLVDASGGDVTVTMPTPSLGAGREFVVKRVDSSGNVVTVSGNGGNIDGSTTQTISTQYEVLRMIGDGTDWWVV